LIKFGAIAGLIYHICGNNTHLIERYFLLSGSIFIQLIVRISIWSLLDFKTYEPLGPD